MPWRVARRGSRYCVIKEGESTPVPGGCHATRADAVRHQRALYAGEEASMAAGDPVNPLWYLTGPNSTWTGGPQVVWADSSTLNEIKWAAVAPAPDPALDDMPEGEQWEGVLAVEGITTSDGRYLMPGKVGHRALPLTLMCQTITDEGHKGAFAAGKITEITREDRPDLAENAVAIVGHGVFADTDEGRKAQELLADEIVRGVSIDFAPTNQYLLDPETLEEINDDDTDIMELLSGNYVRGFEGNIMGATLCPFPAFEDATLQIVEAGNKVVVASCISMRKVLTAAAAGIAPLAPPYDWFFQAEPPGPFPLTVMDDGRVMGHLALWNQCHRGLADHCEMAPRSRSGYAYFHTGSITTDDGRKVNVGRITVGDGGHASVSPYLGTKGAIEHYDKTGLVGAFVRAVDGQHGIWLSGVVRSDCPAEKVRDMEANPPSGDWREENGRLELCAALSVPVAGFPVPRYEAALVASGEVERVVALVASGYTEPGALNRAGQRRIETLKSEARKTLAKRKKMPYEEGTYDDGFRDVSTAERKRLAKTGGAMPDGSFPIANCQDAKNARRALGRANPSKREAVRRHIARRESALGCAKPD